jgi:hypothetical protein
MVEPVELTAAEVDVLRSLARQMGQPALAGTSTEWEDDVRKIVREEIASLAGLALRRTQDRNFTRSGERNIAMEVANEEAAQFWGEVLSEYGRPGKEVPAG